RRAIHRPATSGTAERAISKLRRRQGPRGRPYGGHGSVRGVRIVRRRVLEQTVDSCVAKRYGGWGEPDAHIRRGEEGVSMADGCGLFCSPAEISPGNASPEARSELRAYRIKRT